MIHLGSRISDDPDIFREELVSILSRQSVLEDSLTMTCVYQAEQSRESLLLGQVAGSTEDDNDCVVLELNGAANSWCQQSSTSRRELKLRGIVNESETYPAC